ncbi:MAG: hypothetical protein WC169_05015 [Dehalococcoidia bacterium]
MPLRCPGPSGGGTPALLIRPCPQCGEEVEIFSTDVRVECPACGEVVLNKSNLCAEYCKYAEQCRGKGHLQRAQIQD